MSSGDRFSAPLIDLVDGLKKAAFRFTLIVIAVSFTVTAIVIGALFALALAGYFP